LRQFNLPANADLTTVEATFRDGILEIAIPKLDRRSLLSLEPY
jgi:HSP20 family molecular chaperone IbpA